MRGIAINCSSQFFSEFCPEFCGILAGILATRSEAVVTAGQAVAAKWLGPYQHR
jgi:hypothetical protein